MPGAVILSGTSTSPGADPASAPNLSRFEERLSRLPEGYVEGHYDGRRWGVTLRRAADGRRAWLFGEARDGSDLVSFNLYRLETSGPRLKPCEMSSTKVIDFVLGFEPDAA